MNTLLQALNTKDTMTCNGAVTNSTSLNYCLDLFFVAGACRNESEQNITTLLTKAYSQDRVTTLKIIFWAGDIRQGAGERRFFKLALGWLAKEHYDDLQKYVQYVPEFSRWDVLFDLDAKCAFDLVIETLKNPNASTPLLCKWLPRKDYATDKHKVVKRNSSTKTTVESISKTKRCLHNGLASKIQKELNWTPKQYRKFLVANTKVVEQQMSAKQWDKIQYSAVPSVAMNKYRKAWYRNDGDRFEKYLQDVENGKDKINAGAIFPHDILKSNIISHGWTFDIEPLTKAQQVQWSNLPNYLENFEGSILPVCDTSGSMCGLPIQICLSLGLYLSERNKGEFKDAFMTFSEKPQLQYLLGSITDRLQQLATADWGGNTNLTAVFTLILKRALEERIPQSDMPKIVLVISDMEFDRCGDITNIDFIKSQYIASGYDVPQIVFWNVNGRVGNVPVTINHDGVALISGASPSIIKSVLTGQINPVNIMNITINTERYSFIQ